MATFGDLSYKFLKFLQQKSIIDRSWNERDKIWSSQKSWEPAFSFQNWKPYKDQVWPMEGAMNINSEIPFQNDLVVRSDTNLSHLTGTPSWFECRQIPLRRWRTQRSRRCDLHVKGRPNPECINMKMRLSNDCDDLKVVMKSLEERVTLRISQAWDMFHNDWLIVLMSWKDPLLAKLEKRMKKSCKIRAICIFSNDANLTQNPEVFCVS